jgi:methyl-accepting chemotaxis protein
MPPGFRRKQYFVEQGLQLRFARFVILFVFISSIVTAILVFYTTFMILGGRLAEVYPQGRLVSIFQSVYLAFFVNLVVILPVIFCGSIVFSHRIAGPLPKIYQALQQIGQGQFDVNLTLRKGDELKELADAINQMAAALKAKEMRK